MIWRVQKKWHGTSPHHFWYFSKWHSYGRRGGCFGASNALPVLSAKPVNTCFPLSFDQRFHASGWMSMPYFQQKKCWLPHRHHRHPNRNRRQQQPCRLKMPFVWQVVEGRHIHRQQGTPSPCPAGRAWKRSHISLMLQTQSPIYFYNAMSTVLLSDGTIISLIIGG